MKTKFYLLALLFVLSMVILPVGAMAADTPYTNDDDITKEQYSKVSFDRELDYSSTEVLVTFAQKASSEAIGASLSGAGSMTKNELMDGEFVVVSVPEGKPVEDFMYELAKSDLVQSVQPNYRYYLEENVNDPYAQAPDADQWHLDTIGAYGAWDTTMGSSDVVVAVLDTGVDLSHPDLMWQIDMQTDVVDNDGAAWDDNGHGTHVCGTIAAQANNAQANNNATGGAGVAPGVRLMVIDVFDSNGTDWWAEDVDIVEGITSAINNGADIINMSLGNYIASSAIETAVNDAISAGIVVVAAAGNDTVATPHYPSDFPGVISVTATDESNDIAYFSNYGAPKDVCAPGCNIYAAEMDGDYIYMSGTSMATPIVSGVVALMLSARPSLTVDEVKNILYNTATDLGAPGRDVYYGHGLVNAAAAVVGAVDPSQDIGDPDFRDGDYIYWDHGDGTCSITEYTGSASDLTIPGTLDGLTVTGIDQEAFKYGYQYNVTFPDTIEYIDTDAFYWNELITVDLPASLEYIGEAAFAKNDMVEVTLPAGTSDLDDLAFWECAVLNTVYVPTSVGHIGADAFSDCGSGLTFYGTLGSYAQSYASANGIPFAISFSRSEDAVSSGMLCRTFFNESDDVVCREYYRGSTDTSARIQADYYNMAGTMVFTEVYDASDTIIASIWFQDDGVTKQFKNYYNYGTLYFQEEYDATDTLIASIWFQADGRTRHFKNYYNGGTLYFQEEYNTGGTMIASIWFQADGVTRHFKNYYNGGVLYFQEEYNTGGTMVASIWFQPDGVTRHFKNYYSGGVLYFQEEYNTSGVMIASIDFWPDGETRQRKCYYQESDGALYLIEYYDVNGNFVYSERFGDETPAGLQIGSNGSFYLAADGVNVHTFIPRSTRTYTIYSQGYTDTVAGFFLGDTCLVADDDSGEFSNFRFSVYLTAGVEYDLVVIGYYDYTAGEYWIVIED